MTSDPVALADALSELEDWLEGAGKKDTADWWAARSNHELMTGPTLASGPSSEQIEDAQALLEKYRGVLKPIP